MDFKLYQPVPQLLRNIKVPEQSPHEDNITINNSEELGSTYALHAPIKQEINTNSNDSDLMVLKQEELDIKIESDDSADNFEEMRGTAYDLSAVKHEEPNNLDKSSVFRAVMASMKRRKLRQKAEKQFFSCAHCSYKSIRKPTLIDHLRTHTGDKPYSCTLCNYKSARSSQITRHQITHSEEKPYRCTLCEYKSFWKDCFEYHCKTHANEKPYSCNCCSYKSVMKSSLIKHMAKHTRGKRYNCTICDFRCSRKHEFAKHREMHTGKKYNCAECSYACSQNKSLRFHIKTHAVDQPYSCEFCDNKFARKLSLTCHLKTHTIAKTNCTFNKSDGKDSENNLNLDLEQVKTEFEVDDHKLETLKVEELDIKEEF